MASPKLQQSLDSHYSPIPTQNDAVLPPLNPTLRRRTRCFLAISAALLLVLLPSLAYLFWPSDPTLQIVRLHLEKFHIHLFPAVNVDVTFQATVKVSNVDVYSMDFRRMEVALSYRGRRLGHVISGEGHVRAFGSSYVDAEVEIRGVRVASDVAYLLDDVAKGRVPFDTVTEVGGTRGFLVFGFPFKAKMACEVLVHTENKTIVHQNCYPQR